MSDAPEVGTHELSGLEILGERLVQRVGDDPLRLLGSMTRGLSHDIAQGLQIINAASVILQADATLTDIQRKHVTAIAEAARQVRDLLDILRNFQPLSHLSEEYSVIIIPELVTTVTMLAAYLAEGQGKKVTISAEVAACSVLGNPTQLFQALLNLVANSIDAIEYQGTINIHGSACMQKIRITITDDGPGMTPEVLEKCTQPNFTTKEHGSGIGLALVKQIVATHRGELSILSRHDEGTQCVITLPLYTSET